MLRLLQVAVALMMLSTGGAFAQGQVGGLVDQTGASFDQTSLSGGFHLVYFGFTNCPEVCPTSLFEMTAAIDLLPEAERAKVTPIFVTLDPARDTSELMARYVQPLGHGFVTVSGPVEAIDRFAAQNRIVAVRNLPEPDGSYSVDHSSEVILFGPDGREIERFPYSMDYREVAQRLGNHVASTPRS